MNPSGSQRNIFGKRFNKRNVTTKASFQWWRQGFRTKIICLCGPFHVSRTHDELTNIPGLPANNLNSTGTPDPTSRGCRSKSKLPRPHSSAVQKPQLESEPDQRYIEFYQKQQQNRLSAVMGDGIVRRGSREGSPNSTIGGLRITTVH